MSGINLLSPNFKSMKVVAPSGGYTAGEMVKVEDTVGVIVSDTDAGEDAVLIYSAEKIIVPKVSGVAIAAGDLVYYNASSKAVTNSSSGNTLCGKAIAAAASDDTSVKIDLIG